jgi:release factor glutamine methyltransferase
VPRPETEELLELVLEKTKPEEGAAIRVLDLGTGTGALALALAKAWPAARVTAVDASDDALALARENAASSGLEAQVTFLKSNWFSALAPDACFEVIVSNPPYLTDDEVAEAEPEVRIHDPRTALVAAEAGMADLRVILAGAPARLAEGGLLAVETGIAQHSALLAEAVKAGLAQAESRKDLSGRDRFITARR